jgi:hypothetical protein
MPLRDHFRPPLDNFTSWEGLHGQWPAVIVQHLPNQLPAGFVAEPRVHSGSPLEIDVSAFEKDDARSTNGISEANGGVATAVWAPPAASLAIETELPDFDEYEVRIYDAKRGRRLVAHRRSRHRSAIQFACRGVGFFGPQRTDVERPAAAHLCHVLPVGEKRETDAGGMVAPFGRGSTGAEIAVVAKR